jgi:hypothetical protein
VDVFTGCSLSIKTFLPLNLSCFLENCNDTFAHRRVSPWQPENEYCFKAISIELAADMQCEAFHTSTTGMKVFTGTTRDFTTQYSRPNTPTSRVNSTPTSQETTEVTLATETQRPLFQNLTTEEMLTKTTIDMATFLVQDTVTSYTGNTFATSEPLSTSTETSTEFSPASEEVVLAPVDVAGAAADAAINIASGALNAAADAAGIAADVAGVAADAAVNTAGAAADTAVNAAGAAVNVAGAAVDAAAGAALGAIGGVFGS